MNLALSKPVKISGSKADKSKKITLNNWFCEALRVLGLPLECPS